MFLDDTACNLASMNLLTFYKDGKFDAAGYIQTMPVGGQTLPGTELRAALGLRSADFDVAVGADNQFTFTTRGYGHGVGLSQYGANAMAVAGKTYREILAAYYPGTMLGSAS